MSAQNQLLIALRYYAIDSFLRVSEDFTGVERSTSGRIVRRVSKALNRNTKFSTGGDNVELYRNRKQFFSMFKLSVIPKYCLSLAR